MDLYLFKLQSINIYNLPLALFHINAHGKLYQPCTFKIDPDGIIELVPGQFVKDYTDNLTKNFRRLDWIPILPSLKNIANVADSQSQHIVIGTYIDEQFKFLKDNLNSLSIEISYTDAEYPVMLNSLAKQHIYLLRNGSLPKNSLDVSLLSSNENQTLVAIYADMFSKLELITPFESANCNYTIPLKAIFNKELLFNYIEELGFNMSDDSINFYNNWINLNSDLTLGL